MPRLRYYKNYSPVGENREDEDDTHDAKWKSGESWLSNNAVIAAMPESKLKEAIRYYKTLVDRLEQELWLRSHTNRYAGIGDSSRSASPTRTRTTQKSIRKSGPGSGTKGIFKGLKLSRELKVALKECLGKEQVCQKRKITS